MLAKRFQNLLVIPSYHYHPVFGREVVRQIASYKPDVIALEIPALWSAEFEWGVSIWPSPVVSYAPHVFLPMIPGDSMVEGCRLANQSGIPLYYIDLALADPINRPAPAALPDAALAPRLGSLFFDATDAMIASAGPAAEGDKAREAHMAARLADLMKRYERVMWIGGMAHWRRIRNRLKAGAFDTPRLKETSSPPSFERMRLESSALYRMTDRLPFQLAGYARKPARYDGLQCLHELAFAAANPESFQAIDIATMLTYARNLEAQEYLSESPGLWQLLTAASSCLGNEYASRLATLALEDRYTAEAERLPLLTHEIEKTCSGTLVGSYRCEGKMVVGEPLWGDSNCAHSYRRLPSRIEITRRQRNDPAAEVQPARSKKEKKAWVAYPDYEVAYEAFVRHVLENIVLQVSQDTTSVPLVSGMGDGLDVRSTVRHWHDGEIYVREPERTAPRIRNGLIDFNSATENSWILQEAGPGTSGDSPYADYLVPFELGNFPARNLMPPGRFCV
jgi:hypothetical protein